MNFFLADTSRKTQNWNDLPIVRFKPTMSHFTAVILFMSNYVFLFFSFLTSQLTTWKNVTSLYTLPDNCFIAVIPIFPFFPLFYFSDSRFNVLKFDYFVIPLAVKIRRVITPEKNVSVFIKCATLRVETIASFNVCFISVPNILILVLFKGLSNLRAFTLYWAW